MNEVLLLSLQSLMGLSVIVFLVGMIKPDWVLFWQLMPSRFVIAIACMIAFMAATTAISELNTDNQTVTVSDLKAK